MARYFFHVSDGSLVLDNVGVELPDVTSAQTTAVQLTAEILKCGMLGPLWNELCWRVEVTDSPPVRRPKILRGQFFNHLRMQRQVGLTRSRRCG
jgi:uncharacterized protein DUF6894